MTRRYRVLAPPRGWPDSLEFKVRTGDTVAGVGDEFDWEFTPEDEEANINTGLLAVVPRTYRVVGDSDVFETAPGGTFDRGLTQGQEALLVASGHIEPVEPEPEPPAPKPPAKKTTPKEK